MRSAATVVGFVCLFVLGALHTEGEERSFWPKQERVGGGGGAAGRSAFGSVLDTDWFNRCGGLGRGEGGASLLPARCQSAKVPAVAAFLQDFLPLKVEPGESVQLLLNES